MIDEQCPPGKTPHLILTTLEASSTDNSIRDVENDFAVIININRWLQNDQYDPLGFLPDSKATTWRRRAEQLQTSPAGVLAINDYSRPRPLQHGSIPSPTKWPRH
jgi:hypothetical protein